MYMLLEISPAASGDSATLWAVLSDWTAVFPGVLVVEGLAAKCEEGKSRRTGLEPRKMVVLAVLGGHVVLVWRDGQGRQEQKSEKSAGTQAKQIPGALGEEGVSDARDFGIHRAAGGLGHEGNSNPTGQLQM